MTFCTFGAYLRALRSAHVPCMTQEDLAKAINRSKMTISQFEKERNAPPQGELLEKIIIALDLTCDEENTLRFLAAEQRKKVPDDIEEYFFSTPYICKAIRAAKEAKLGDSDWEKVIQLIIE